MQTTISTLRTDTVLRSDRAHTTDDISIHTAAIQQMLMDRQFDDLICYLQVLADFCQSDSLFCKNARDIVNRIILIMTDAALQVELPVAQLQDLYARLRDTADPPDRLLADALPVFVRRFQEHIAARSKLLDQIKAYIAKHGNEYDFSMQKMADYFETPLRDLSHLFRQSTGQKLTGYLWNIRLTKARSLLVETSLPIRQVVQDVGYMDVSSFTRKFKAATGYTPGEYRLRYQPVVDSKCTSNA